VLKLETVQFFLTHGVLVENLSFLSFLPTTVSFEALARGFLGPGYKSWYQKLETLDTRRWTLYDPAVISFDALPARAGQTCGQIHRM